jgi:hypothetical protein
MITLTPPEVLDRLIQQGGPSYDPGKGCMYRSEDGRKCAAGLSITDDEYDPLMEHTSIDDVIREFNLTYDGDIDLLTRMQGAHDTASDFVNSDRRLSWEKTLRLHWHDLGLDDGSPR